ncbi:MAG: MFS transporter, partial [Sciscionella sp.]
LGPRYKWVALSNTTLGMLIATINSSIVLIALPDIFKGIHINPLQPSNTSYLLWMIMGFLVVTAVLVVAFGRLGDMFGRARMYNMGFAIFTVSSVFLAVTWLDGGAAAIWLIAWRIIQGIGGAFLMANSSAILTDAFPGNQRGLALGINGVAAIAGSFLGLVIGGLLAPTNWHLIFLVSVPIGVLGTIWAYLRLHDTGIRQHAKMDWWGNITFAVGLIAVLVGITYGIQPYGTSSMGWGSPMVLSCVIGGIAVLVIFGIIETKVVNPLFNLSLFKIRSFSWGNLANLTASLGRGGLQFILIIWLQGIWLPQHGYNYEQTPLWAGIYMLPMTVGFLLSAPTAGIISDKLGTRWFAAVGMVITAGTFGLLIALPVNFDYWAFAAILLVNGIGMGMFAAPNRAEVMNSLPSNARGSGAGMMTTFQNAAMVLSIGVFFSLIIAGLTKNLPSAMIHGLTANGVPAASADQVAHLPAVAVLFAAFLGYNPVRQLLGPQLSQLSQQHQDTLTGLKFFPHLISGPFADGLAVAFWFAIIACVIGAVASLLCGPSKRGRSVHYARVGAELASVAGESGSAPTELVGATSAVPVGGSLAGRVGADEERVVGQATVTVTGPDGKQVDRTLVGEDGSYRLTGMPPGIYTVIVTALGYQPQALALTLPDGGQLTRNFLLVGSGGLRGTVRSRRGHPLPGATVTAVNAGGAVAATAVTDVAGRYRLDGLPGGEYTVVTSVYQPSAVRIDVAAGAHAGADVVLTAAGGNAGPSAHGFGDGAA